MLRGSRFTKDVTSKYRTDCWGLSLGEWCIVYSREDAYATWNVCYESLRGTRGFYFLWNHMLICVCSLNEEARVFKCKSFMEEWVGDYQWCGRLGAVYITFIAWFFSGMENSGFHWGEVSRESTHSNVGSVKIYLYRRTCSVWKEKVLGYVAHGLLTLWGPHNLIIGTCGCFIAARLMTG